MTASESASDRVGTSLLYENDDVRVWDLVLAPGEVSELHHHSFDFLHVYVTEDNSLETRMPEKPAIPVKLPGGCTTFVTVGSGADPILTHRLANVGDHPHRQILVELKQRSRSNGDVAIVERTNSEPRSAA